MTSSGLTMPSALRARLGADHAPVRPLAAPSRRVLWLLPIAVLTLLAAQVFFNQRIDAPRLGWSGTWGLSIAQVGLGFLLMTAALTEAIPGRAWSRLASMLLLTAPILMVVGVTYLSWELSPTRIRGSWPLISGLCLVGSLVSALPAVALGSVLAARAYPTRHALVGALVGFGGGVMADAGWRLFCHFSEPAHVLSAHLGGVVICATLGSLVASRLLRDLRS